MVLGVTLVDGRTGVFDGRVERGIYCLLGLDLSVWTDCIWNSGTAEMEKMSEQQISHDDGGGKDEMSSKEASL